MLGGFLSEEDPATGPAGDLAARQAGLAQAEFDAAQAQLNRRNVAADEIMGLSRSFDPEALGGEPLSPDYLLEPVGQAKWMIKTDVDKLSSGRSNPALPLLSLQHLPLAAKVRNGSN